MAPRKPAPKATAAKTQANAKAKAPAAPVTAPAPAASCSCCAGTASGFSLCALVACCPIGKIVCTRSFWASSVVAFLVVFSTDWYLHSRYLVADYAATSAFWRTDGDIRQSFIFLLQVATAMAYAAIILGLGHAARWWGACASGLLAAAPVAISAASAYVMMPFATPTIPATWAVASLVQGALAGLAICAALKIARAPETHTCCQP